MDTRQLLLDLETPLETYAGAAPVRDVVLAGLRYPTSESREQTLTLRLSNVLARLHRHHDNTSSERVIVHRASLNPGIGSTEHERPEWVDSGHC